MRQTRGAEELGGAPSFMKVAAVALMALGCLAPVHAHFGSCEDHTPTCPRLVKLGLCESLQQFMLQNCPKSCNSCVDPNCYDRSNRCLEVKERGLCQTQKTFMSAHCPHSCEKCKIGPPTAVGFIDLKTIINPDFECGKPLPVQSGRGKRQIIFPGDFEFMNKNRPTNINRRRPNQPPQVQPQPQPQPQPQTTRKPVVPLTPSPETSAPTDSNSVNVEDTFCGATVITDHFLVTAAHCVFDADRPPRTVRVGELDFSRDDEANSRPVDYTIQQIIVHPDFDSSSLERYNDIALIQTKERIQFNELVYPFCLSDNAPVAGTIVTGAGFGLSNVTHRPSQLQEAELEVQEASRCEGLYRQVQSLPQLRLRYPELLQGKSILCASYPERSACQGDSGGPLFQDRNNRRFLVGVVGSGVSCRSNSVSILPGLYINVADHINFINSVVYSPENL